MNTKNAYIKNALLRQISIAFLILVAVTFAFPSVAAASSDNVTLNYVSGAETEMEYDGRSKEITVKELDEEIKKIKISAPDGTESEHIVSGKSFTFTAGPGSGCWILTFVHEDEATQRETTARINITKRRITVKPADVIAEAKGQSIRADRLQIKSGSLADGHDFDTAGIRFEGSLDTVGDAESSISGIIRIVDTNAGNRDLTHNYEVSVENGLLKLVEPFQVETDPEVEGTLGGGTTAGPTGDSTSSSSASSGKAGVTSALVTGNAAAAALETVPEAVEIADGEVPLHSGSQSPKNVSEGSDGANIFTGASLFAIILVIAAATVLTVFALLRRRRENQ